MVTGGVDYGHVRRPLPVAKALDDVLLAYEMNGEPLPPDHGFPLRLVVPGWIGIASIKWLGQIEVSDQPLFSPWNTKWYRLTGADYPPDSPPITTQVVKIGVRARPGRAIPGRPPRDRRRPLLVRHERDPPRRGEHRQRRDLAPRAASRPERARRLGSWHVHRPRATPGRLRAAGRARRTGRPSSASTRRSTRTDTSSVPWCGTPSSCADDPRDFPGASHHAFSYGQNWRVLTGGAGGPAPPGEST